MLVKCDNCGTQFERKQSAINEHNFCSRKCFYIFRRKKMVVICDNCGKELKRIPAKIGNRNFCNQQCYRESQGVIVTCNNCGKKLKRVPNGKNNFCNSKCHRESRGVAVICDNCGKTFKQYPHIIKERNYCSKKCFGKSKCTQIDVICNGCGKTFKKRLNQVRKYNYCGHKCRRKRVIVTCNNCGKNIERVPSAVRKYNFCSHSCSAKFNLKNFRKPKQLKLTQPEIKIDTLTNKKVKYTGNGSFWRRLPHGHSSNPDFIVEPIEETKKVIYYHGGYWHDDELPDRGKELIEGWQKIGYQCLIIWFDELKNDEGAVKKRIQNFIKDKSSQLAIF